MENVPHHHQHRRIYSNVTCRMAKWGNTLKHDNKAILSIHLQNKVWFCVRGIQRSRLYPSFHIRGDLYLKGAFTNGLGALQKAFSLPLLSVWIFSHLYLISITGGYQILLIYTSTWIQLWLWNVPWSIKNTRVSIILPVQTAEMNHAVLLHWLFSKVEWM